MAATLSTSKPSSSAAPPARRTAARAGGLAEYVQARAMAVAAFNATPRIQPLWRALSAAADRLLQQIATQHGLTLVATGGYGRHELFPYSDIDILVLLPSPADTVTAQKLADALQSMWDHQVPLSHATRTVADTLTLASQDATISAALMDARLVAGDRKLFLALKRGLRQQVFGVQPRRFVDAKLTERDLRHARYGDSRFMLEPNVKEGKGGLRDLQTLAWLTRYCYGVARAQDVIRDDMLSAAEWRHYRQAYLFFATVRACIHLARGRADDRLSFDLQPQIAAALGFRGRTPQQRAERLMLRYFQFARAVGTMTRILCATLEQQQMRSQPASFMQAQAAEQLPEYLVMEHGRLNFSPQADLMESPHQMIGLFAQAQLHGLDIHPHAQLAISRLLPRMGRRLPLDGYANSLLLFIMLSQQAPENSLRRLNECGVLAAIVPEFGRLTGQMQYDGYHTYTVDEHILVAIGHLHQLESGSLVAQHPLATRLASEQGNRRVLYTAMLCHDIAKGKGGGHADKGAAMAHTVAQRLGLDASETALVAWLVKHHALLSDTAFKRDLDDAQTITDFVAQVQSPERLRLLLLLTVADIKAVGPNIFNGWKGALMRTLYQRALTAMGAGGVTLAAQPPDADLLQEWKLKPGQIAMRVVHDEVQAASTIRICAATQPRLLSTLAGAMASLGASIVSARMRPLGEDEAEGASLAEFVVQNSHGDNFADDERRLRQLPKLVQQALAEPALLASKLAARRLVARAQTVPVKTGLFIDNQGSAEASVVEVNARDRIGLLHAILQAFDACQLQVMTAHIATYGQLAVDVFYVKDAYGHKITHHARQQQLQQELQRLLDNPLSEEPCP